MNDPLQTPEAEDRPADSAPYEIEQMLRLDHLHLSFLAVHISR